VAELVAVMMVKINPPYWQLFSSPSADAPAKDCITTSEPSNDLRQPGILDLCVSISTTNTHVVIQPGCWLRRLR
jgi:hypothetical protein